jgi:hypothetical protein
VRESGAKKLAGSRVVPDIVPARTADQLDPCELLVVPDGVVGCTGQRFLRSLVLPTQELDPADLAPTRRGDIVSSRLLGERRSFVQRRGALLVRAPSRVDERAAQRNERHREKLAVADPSSGRDGTAQPVQTGLAGAGGERGLTGLDLGHHLRAPRNATRSDHLRCDSGRAKRRGWLDAKVALEELGACLHLAHRGLGIACRTRQRTSSTWGFSSYGLSRTSSEVKSGTFTVYHARDCEPTVYGPGDAFVELPSTVHVGRNETGDVVELGVVFFGVPIGGSPRIDQAQPEDCEIT